MNKGHTNLSSMSHSIMRNNIKIDETFDINEYARSLRRIYINKCLNHKSLKYCPECGGEIEYSNEDEDEAYCTNCGLVTSASSCYVAGVKINLPYGIRLQ